MTSLAAAEWVYADKRWHDRMDQNREDMRKKLQEARDHFAKELHNDQVTMEREKLRRSRKMAGSLAIHRQAWSDFEATDWASSGPIRLVRLSYIATLSPAASRCSWLQLLSALLSARTLSLTAVCSHCAGRHSISTGQAQCSLPATQRDSCGAKGSVS